MQRGTQLRLRYADLLLRSYSKRFADPARVRAQHVDRLRDLRAVQEGLLRRILETHAGTAYGRRHGFAEIGGPEGYRDRVPVATYEDLRPWMERMLEGEKDVLVAGAPSFFSTTSGSTARPKFVPGVLAGITAGCDALLARNAFLHGDHPRAFAGRALFVVGSAAEGTTRGGVSYGAMTGFGYAAGQVGFQGRPFPHSVFSLDDYEARDHCLLRLALARRDVTVLAAYNPSTLVVLLSAARSRWDDLLAGISAGGLPPDLDLPAAVAEDLEPELVPDPERARELTGLADAGPRAWWPRLAAVLCWKGGSAGFYLRELAADLEGLPVRELGLLASEAMVTVPVDDDGAPVLLPETAFWELAPLDDPEAAPVPAWEVEDGASYRVLCTTPSGLYRYDLGDVVRVDGFFEGAPRLAFLRRAGRIHSFTGEKLTEEHVTLAVRAAADASGVRLAGFTAVPRWEMPPRYELLMELGEPAGREGESGDAAARDFARRLDPALQEVNAEYAGKRRSGRLAATTVARVAPGSFAARRRSAAAREAQFKESHLACDPAMVPEMKVLEVMP